MSSNTNQNMNPWGTASTSSHSGMGPLFNTDALGQSTTTQYQRGYMMPSQPQKAMPSEMPIVPTKAKMNFGVSGSVLHPGRRDTEFGARDAAQNDDTPPTTSVEHLFNSTIGTTPRAPSSIPDSLTFSPSRAPRIEPAPSSSPVYVIIFGYPLDKYSVTVEYFKSFGPSADPEPNTEIVNCFRIGYRDASDAMRAVKRNGEVLKGTYMIGVKWADPAAAADLVSSTRSELAVAPSPSIQSHPMDVPPVPSFSTPIHLAPSSAAFRKPGTPGTQKPGLAVPAAGPVGHLPTKGVVGQMSDLLFGW